MWKCPRGLGKTAIGAVWAKAFLNTYEEMKIFIIAPVTLHDDWRRTLAEATGLKLDAGDKKKKAKKKGKASKKKNNKKKGVTERTVTGKRRKRPLKRDSDSEDGEPEEPASDGTDEVDVHILSWSSVSAYKNVINDISDYVVIADEAHHMQNMTSKRTEDTLKLCFPKKWVLND